MYQYMLHVVTGYDNGDRKILMAKVRHSQSVSAEICGIIVCSHCTCMAGSMLPHRGSTVAALS